MKAEAWLTQATKSLAQAGISTARLDALVLLEDLASKDRAWLLSHPDHELSSDQITKLKKLLRRRAEHVPLAYVRGHSEFYGRDFIITPAVLEPRPESETMIDLLKNLSDLPTPTYIADIGSGSGALGITAKLELDDALVDLIEVDPMALKVSKVNVDKFTLKVRVIESDLLAKVNQDYNLLLCNLPYVPDGFQINTAALHEPSRAIFGGPDGLDIYRELFHQMDNVKKRPLYILTESLPPQHQELKKIARSAGYKLQRSDDFIQIFTTK